MGCWNETCGISQMPIEAGDPVRMFLIVENKYSGKSSRDHVLSYSSDLWRPFGLPIKGTYDEYGSLETIEEDIMSDYLLESIKEMVIEVPDRMGNVFKREELDWPTVLGFLTDEGLRVTDPFDVANITKKLDKILAEVKTKVPNLPANGWSSERGQLADQQRKLADSEPRVIKMYHMMVHEDIYQAILNYKIPAERFSSWTDGDIKDALRAGAKQFVAQIREEQAELAKMPEDEKIRAISLNRLSRHSLDFDNRFVSMTSHLDGSYGSGRYLQKYLSFVEKRITAGAPDDDPQIQLLTEQFVGFAAFSQAMSLLRKLWMPQTGKGGQDREFVLHKYLSQVVQDFSDKKIKAWDEMYGEYDEEEDAEESK